MVRFPGAWRALAALVQRLLRPSSRLRRALLRRNVVSGWAAASRRDFELMLVLYATDVVTELDPDLEVVGLAGPFRGHEGRLEWERAFQEEWQRWEALPTTVLDLGDRQVVLGKLRLAGKVSGLELEREVAQVLTPRDGLVAHERIFMAWDKGLRAAGLDPDAIVLPPPAKAAATASGAA